MDINKPTIADWVNCTTASATTSGMLSSTNFNTFNGKSGAYPTTTWTSFTPSWTGTGENPTFGTNTRQFYYRLNSSGDLEIFASLYQTNNTGASAGLGAYLMLLPNSYTANTTVSVVGSGAYSPNQGTPLGSFYINATSTDDTGFGVVKLYDSTHIYFEMIFNRDDSTYEYCHWGDQISATKSAIAMSFNCVIPI
jgi:hypothetical protein